MIIQNYIAIISLFQALQLLYFQLVVLNHFLQLELRPMLGLVMLPHKAVVHILPYLPDKVVMVTHKMVGAEPVAVGTLPVGIVLREPCGHVRPGEVMAAIHHPERLDLPARDTLEVLEPVCPAVPKSDVPGENLVQPPYVVGPPFRYPFVLATGFFTM